MQGKVSMVVPCYNKAKYIGMMLDSVIAQEWNNIELILVNDGSTDGTREVIAEYESKLIARGFSVIIIDQENAGCCAAVYTGLIRMSGDYFCLVDCDDMIEPKYVSRMAGWLDAYDDCEWAACTFRPITLSDNKMHPPGVKKYRPDSGKLLERHIFRTTFSAVWIYMVRVRYLKECGLVDNFCIERRATYEPLIIVPLANGKGKLEFINEPLYLFNQDAMGLSRFDTIEQCLNFYDDYIYLYNWSIDRINASESVKKRLKDIARIGYYKDLYRHTKRMINNEAMIAFITQGLITAHRDILRSDKRINIKKLIEKGLNRIFNAIENVYVES